MFVNVLARSSEESWVLGGYMPTHNVGMLFGIGLGFGFEHEFSTGILLYLNPHVRWNGFGGLVKIRPAYDLIFPTFKSQMQLFCPANIAKNIHEVSKS